METHVETVETREKPTRKDKRPAVTIHFTRGKDDDLIRLIFALGRGQRGPAVLAMLRGVASGKGAALPMPKQMALDLPDYSSKLDQLVDKMLWMEQAITDMPGYFENVIQQVASTRPARSKTTPASLPPPEPEPERVSDKILNQRSNGLKKARW